MRLIVKKIKLQIEQDFNKEIIKILETISSRGYSLWKVFTDWLELMCLAAQNLDSIDEHNSREKKYLKIMSRYSNDQEEGKREADLFSHAFGLLRLGTTETKNDLLGTLYENLSLSHKGFGQFFTPREVCKLIAQMTFDANDKDSPSVLDPCVGSGRMLVEAAKIKPKGFYAGQDIDFTCVQMTTLNFWLLGIDGLVILGDSLKLELKMAYRTYKNHLFLIEKESEYWSMVVNMMKPGSAENAVTLEQSSLQQFISPEEATTETEH